MSKSKGTWHCVFCGKEVADERAECCGEVGHTEFSSNDEPKMDETFYGYRFTGVVEKDPGYTHDGPTRIDAKTPRMKYVSANIVKYPEIRIVDDGDLTVMQIINQRLIFPMPDGVEVPPIWDAVIGKFVPYAGD